jgi:hypothetical protein
VFVAERKAAPVRLSWRPVETDASYRVAVARGPDLSGEDGETTAECALELELEPGTYYWGVYLVAEGLAPLFLEPRKLTVVAGAPRIMVPSAIEHWGQ